MAKVSFFCFWVLPGLFRIKTWTLQFMACARRIQMWSAISPRSTRKSTTVPAPPLRRYEASQGWLAIAVERLSNTAEIPDARYLLPACLRAASAPSGQLHKCQNRGEHSRLNWCHLHVRAGSMRGEEVASISDRSAFLNRRHPSR